MKLNTILLTVLATVLTTASMSDTKSFDFDKLKGRDNLNQTPLGTSGQWSLEKLLALTAQEGIALWRTLPAPPFQEMNGHYLGLRPSAGNTQLIDNKKLFNEKPDGYWLGKAFKPTTATTGEGYNRMRLPGGKVARLARMGTRIDKSFLDGKPAFILDYNAFHKNAKGVDELRKLEDAIYLGILTVDLGNGKRSEPDFFILVGPTDEWVGPDKN